MTDEQIRAIFLAHGFTIKPGHTDLKPYVYAAARAILAAREPEPPNACVVRFMGIDPLNPTEGAALPMIPDSWRFGFHSTGVAGTGMTFGLRDDGEFVAYEAVRGLVEGAGEEPQPAASDERAFSSWWGGSKYCQVIVPETGWRQIAWDAWHAAQAPKEPKPDVARDAARYRWLRSHGYTMSSERKSIENELLPAGEEFDSIDDALDAALATPKEAPREPQTAEPVNDLGMHVVQCRDV